MISAKIIGEMTLKKLPKNVKISPKWKIVRNIKVALAMNNILRNHERKSNFKFLNMPNPLIFILALQKMCPLWTHFGIKVAKR